MAALALPAAMAGVVLGILAADAGTLPGGGLPAIGLGVALVIAVAVLRGPGRGPLVALGVGVVLIGIGVGAWRGATTALPTGSDSVIGHIGPTSWRVVGTVVEEPRPRGERQQAILDELVLAGDGLPAHSVRGRLLVWLPRAQLTQAGDRVALEARLDAPRDFEGFAYGAYLARQGIGAVASAYGAEVVEHRLGIVAEALGGLRRGLLSGLNALVPEPEAALASGILLGIRTSIAPEVSDAFARAGLTHVVAISGWNIAIVAAMASAATRPLTRLRGGRQAAVAAASLMVASYVLLTGASPSVVRAALMAGGLVIARVGGSRAHALSALLLAALVMLVAAPPVLWDVGFQLSALATAGLIWFAAPLEARLARWPALVREPVALTLAAQLTTLPVILLNFERLSLVAPLANVAVVPLVPLVMLCSAVAAVIGAVDGAAHLPLIGDVLGWAAGGAAWLYLRLMILTGMAAAAVPFASIDLAAPSWLALAWYPALAMARGRIGPATAPASSAPAMPDGLAALAGGALRPARLGAGTLVVLALLTFVTRPDGRLELVMLDVGQGDAILIRAPSGATALVDGGVDPDLTMRRLGEVLPFWQRRLDVVLLTHPHEDHVAGLVAALDRFRVGLVLDPGRQYHNPSYPRFLDLARREPGARLVTVRAGDRVPLDGTTALTFLFPSEADAAAPLLEGDINNASAVALLESGAFRALLTGDAEAPVEALLLERGLLGPIDVLKVGHHGSDSGTTDALLEATRPRLALISSGAGNEYGHPHAVTLARLAAIPGLRIHRTDLEGTIRVVASGGRFAAVGQRRPDPGSIGPWPSPPMTRPRRSSPRSTCRTGSSRTRAGLPGLPPRRRAWWWAAASGWTWTSSRSPPCCTTSTSWRPGMAGACTAWSAPGG
jgi:competence protein ComEC